MDSHTKASNVSLLTKTKMCRFAGGCSLGASCRFAHDLSELKSKPDLSKTKMCKSFTATGRCDAVHCQYAHGRHELRKLAVNRGRNVKKMSASDKFETDCVARLQGHTGCDIVGTMIQQAVANADIPARVAFSV